MPLRAGNELASRRFPDVLSRIVREELPGKGVEVDREYHVFLALRSSCGDFVRNCPRLPPNFPPLRFCIDFQILATSSGGSQRMGYSQIPFCPFRESIENSHPGRLSKSIMVI